MKKIKLALICTRGGHFEQMINLQPLYSLYNYFWITNKNSQTESVLFNEHKYYIGLAHFKKPWQYLYQMPKMIKILYKEKPTHIISTGSGRTAFIPLLLARIFKICFIFIDTFSRVNGLSKMGRFVHGIGYPVYVQWGKKNMKRTIYIGPIFQGITNKISNMSEDIIFVTLGTREESFIRLLNYIERLISDGSITEKVIVQAGFTKFVSEKIEIFDFCSADEIDKYILRSKYVITQESAGLATRCLKLNKKFIVVPRDYKFKELPTRSDMEEDLHYKLEELGYTKVATNLNELEYAIKNLDKLKVGFEFDNTYALEILMRFIEGE